MQGMVNFTELFQRTAPVVLEIGFGRGDALLQMAKEHPEKNYLGIEVHPLGVAALLQRIAQEGLSNIRIYQEDAVLVLDQCIRGISLSVIYLFFPDPWPKRRHHKRRLIQAAFIDLVYRKLVSGGSLHMATDWWPYAEQAMKVISQHTGFDNPIGERAFFKNQSVRVPTRFEHRARRLGHDVWDLLFVKNTNQTEP